MVLSLAALWAAQVRQNLVSSIVKRLKIVTDSVTNVANIASSWQHNYSHCLDWKQYLLKFLLLDPWPSFSTFAVEVTSKEFALRTSANLWCSELCYSSTCTDSSTSKYYAMRCKTSLGFCFLSSPVACWIWASWLWVRYFACYIWKIKHKVCWVKIVRKVNRKKIIDNEKLQLNSWKGLGRWC